MGELHQPLLHVGEVCHLQESMSQYVQQSTTDTIIQHLESPILPTTNIIRTILNDMSSQDIIEPSYSLWSSPIVLAQKKTELRTSVLTKDN